MNLRNLLPTLALLLIAIPAAAAPVIDADAATKIDAAVQAAIADRRTPSCCVVIGTADRVLFAKAYGRCTYDPASPPVTLDTMYDMASCSKPVATASALALLLQDGRISLEDPVSKYLPSWNRDDKRAITIRNLVTHTSGLPSYTSASRAESGRKPGETTADALINCIASLPLQYKTGEGHLYSCLNFLTLARVNEEVAGVNQETLLRKRIWGPLGMKDTGYYLSESQKGLCAPTTPALQGDVHDPLANYYRDGYHCPGNAGLFTTANDLTKFCRMILSNGRYDHWRYFRQCRIFSPRIVDMFFTNEAPTDPKYTWGLGWGISSSQPHAYAAQPSPQAVSSAQAWSILSSSKDEGRSARIEASTPLVLSRVLSPSKDAKRIEERSIAAKTARISHTGYTGTAIEFDRRAGTFMIMLTNRVYPDDKASLGRLRSAIRKVMTDSDPANQLAPPGP